jgi:hypothetical protein
MIRIYRLRELGESEERDDKKKMMEGDDEGNGKNKMPLNLVDTSFHWLGDQVT